MNNDYIEFRADSVTVKHPHWAVGSDGITKFYTADTVYACMEERTEDQLTAYRRLMGHEPDLVTTEDAVDINRLREKAAELEKERDQLRRELDNVHGLVRVMKADHAWREGKWATAKVVYEKRIKDQAEKIDHLLQDRVELRTQLDNKDTKIDSLLQENVVLQAQLADKNNTIKLLQGMFADRAWEDTFKRIDAIELENAASLIVEIVELKKANAELKLKHKDEKAQLSEAYENLIIGLKEENTCLKKTCEDLRLATEKKAETFVSMSNTIADLKEKNRKLRSQIKNLEEDAKALRRRTCEDGQRMRHLRLTDRELKKQIDEMQGTVEATRKTLVGLTAENNKLKLTQDELLLENAGLRGKLIYLESFRP